MKYLKTFEANFSDNIKNIFKNDIYYINKDDYIYSDGFSRYFKRGDTVIFSKSPEQKNSFIFYNGFETGDKLRILRMEGQNAKVINLKNNKIEVLSLNNMLSEEDYNLNISLNKYNL